MIVTVDPSSWTLNQWFGVYTLGLWIVLVILILVLGRE